MTTSDDRSLPPDTPDKGRSGFRIDTSMLVIALVSVGCAIVVYVRDGMDEVLEILGHSSWLIVDVVPRILAGSLIGGFLACVIPRERIARTLGSESGFWGLLFGTFVGALVPGGPYTIYPIASALLVAGADSGAIIAFVTSWTLLGYARALIWELPFMGPDFTFWRVMLCLPLPILAGWLGRLAMRAIPALGIGR